MDAKRRGMTTLLVGLDAACESVLDPLFDAGVIPNLERVIEAGVSAPLESQVPPWTPSAWPSLYTGMNPGKHGVFDFLDFDGYDWSVVNASHLRERPMWSHLDHYGLTSVVVNVPVTHPPRPFEGALIPGYIAPEDPTCHPEGLLDDVRSEIGGYRVYPDGGDPPSAAAHAELAAMRGRAFRYLAERFDPDFGFVQFQGTDSVFHERPGDAAAVRSVYGAVDEQVGRILDSCDPDNVIVASDHGIGEYEGTGFHVNEYLRGEGFVKSKRGGLGMPSWATVRETRFKEGSDAGEPRRGVLSKSMAVVAKAGLTSQRLAGVLESLGVDHVVRRWVPSSVVSAAAEQVDFAASSAYVRSRTECGVRINLEGREPDGVVAPEEYDAVLEELIDVLSSARTPDGEPVFEDVAPREAYFEGPAANDAVDVVTVPAGFDHFIDAGLSGAVFDEPAEPWNHKRHGYFAASGAAVDPTAPMDDAHLFDVAPTVLSTFDVPADERMDGSSLPIVESFGERPYPREGRRRTRARTTDAPDVERRLADLGYLDGDR